MNLGELYFIRHGQASYGTDDYDRLSDLGWQQARWLGQHFSACGLDFDAVVTGAMRRHRETAAAIMEASGHHVPDETPGLNEMDYDLLYEDAERAGLFPALPDHTQNAFRVTMPILMQAWEDGTFATTHEPYAVFRDRVLAAVKAASGAGKRVLVVSSGGPKSVVLRHVLGADSATMTRLILQTKNASVTRFGLYDDGLHLAEFNTVPHLSGSARAHAHTYI